MNVKLLVGGAIVFCLALIGLAYYVSTTQVSSGGPRILELDPSYTKRIEQGGWVKGTENPQVTVIEYGDFQCPACYVANPYVREAVDQTSDITRFVYRHYPLSQIHDKALVAATAAEAAGRQGKFWEMHDLIFSQQNNWNAAAPSSFRKTLEEYAKTLGLNIEQFQKDMKDTKIVDQISNDRKAGDELPVQGTPTILINGKLYDKVPSSTQELVTAIRAAATQTNAQ
ncbi:MAG: nhaA2 [Patescibacteria group bacterium]|jgi:protein-disulfide isomerase|nr:nhaA2 [Patescibacteria group bacterium]